MPAAPRQSREEAVALAREAGRGAMVPRIRRLTSDQMTPVMAYRRLVYPDARMAPSFLLESVEGGARVGRYSYLGSRPVLEVLARGHAVEVIDHDRPDAGRRFESEDPLAEVRRLTEQWRPVPLTDLPDFAGGWVGYAGYDVVRYLEGEKLAHPPPDDRGLPDLHFQFYRHLVAFDHVQKTVLAIAHARVEDPDRAAEAIDAADAELAALVERLADTAADARVGIGEPELAAPPPALPVSNFGAGGYQEAVRRVKAYVAAGDAFQVVPSQRFELETAADPFDIYRALRVVNPSPYMFYVQARGAILVGSSPEILCRVQDGVVVNRPLAGTRRRGRDEAEDRALEAELLADPKERAEHIMLVDLGRNDVGRIAEPGSIALPNLLEIERYSHVMHISSTVTGRLRAGCDCWDALRHTLPVGTVSGAPKVRAMQIIDELEPTRRGPYGGAVGYADLDGNMDMAIALRTMVVLPGAAAGRWRVHLQAGGGIVADSEPEAEHQETVNKAAALAKAVQVAETAF